MASNPSVQSNQPKRPQKPRSKSNQRPGNPKLDLPSVSNAMENLLMDLECPVCQEHLSAPIFLCSIGHNLCGDCKTKLPVPVCPICKAALTTQRNFALEAICEKLSQPCENAVYGCKYVGSADRLKGHAKTCSFQPYLCPMGVVRQNCTWKGRRTDLVQHFSQMHQNKMDVRPSGEIIFSNLNVGMEDADLQLISFRNTLFLYHVKIHPMRGVANFAIQCIGDKQLANQWIYEFNFYNKASCKQLKTVDQCTSNDLNVDAVYSSGDCVSIPLNVVRKFTVPSNNFTFKFFLKKKDDPDNKPKPNLNKNNPNHPGRPNVVQ